MTHDLVARDRRGAGRGRSVGCRKPAGWQGERRALEDFGAKGELFDVIFVGFLVVWGICF